jgi:processive 1,2-diacylglycerol beta-glucosyltransferase
VIISTYPVPAAVVAWLKQRRLIKCTLVTVITDYMLHQTWIQPGTDLYIAPSETVAGELIRQGILPEQVAVTGIPIDHRFMDEASRALPGLLSDLPEELQGLPVVLLISGATNFGGDLSRICRLLAGLPVPHVAVVLGVRYPQRRLNLTRLVSKGRNRVFIVGYSQEVPMFMAAASCMISKAGGITISEALATELPMIIYKALPCQEEMNRDFLTREGAALAARNLNELGRMLGDVLQNEGLRARMENAAARLKHPDAASAAVSRMAPYLEKQKPEARSRRLALTIKAGRKAGRRIQKRFRHPINGIRLLFYVNNRRAKRKKPPRL